MMTRRIVAAHNNKPQPEIVRPVYGSPYLARRTLVPNCNVYQMSDIIICVSFLIAAGVMKMRNYDFPESQHRTACYCVVELSWLVLFGPILCKLDQQVIIISDDRATLLIGTSNIYVSMCVCENCTDRYFAFGLVHFSGTVNPTYPLHICVYVIQRALQILQHFCSQLCHILYEDELNDLVKIL